MRKPLSRLERAYMAGMRYGIDLCGYESDMRDVEIMRKSKAKAHFDEWLKRDLKRNAIRAVNSEIVEY